MRHTEAILGAERFRKMHSTHTLIANNSSEIYKFQMSHHFFATMIMAASSALALGEGAPPSDPASVQRVAIALLYAEPEGSTNKRFADMRSTHFGGGTYKSREVVLRGRTLLGDGAGFDGHFALELNALAAEAARRYDAGTLTLTHRYFGIDGSAGGTFIIRPNISAYFEGGLVLPSIKNTVELASAAGSATYTDDYDDGSWIASGGLNFGSAIGLEVRPYDDWIVTAHLDAWRRGSGKPGGFHFGAGYAF